MEEICKQTEKYDNVYWNVDKNRIFIGVLQHCDSTIRSLELYLLITCTYVGLLMILSFLPTVPVYGGY